jgi:hypothetical protein
MISRHELELVSLLTDKDIENIRKDICEECNIEYCEKNLPCIDEIILKSWKPNHIKLMKDDARREKVQLLAKQVVIKVLPLVVPIMYKIMCH